MKLFTVEYLYIPCHRFVKNTFNAMKYAIHDSWQCAIFLYSFPNGTSYIILRKLLKEKKNTNISSLLICYGFIHSQNSLNKMQISKNFNRRKKNAYYLFKIERITVKYLFIFQTERISLLLYLIKIFFSTNLTPIYFHRVYGPKERGQFFKADSFNCCSKDIINPSSFLLYS